MIKTVFRRKKSIFLYLIVSTVILCYGSVNKSMQAIDRPVSRNKKISTLPQNTDVPSSMKSKISHSNFMEHDPIFIDGNDDFISQANTEGWPGDGTGTNSFIIDDLEITSSDSLISISNTDLHFQISNCLLANGGGAGISLNNVKNGYIYNNSIHDNNWIGIRLVFSDNNIISNNIVFNSNPVGISLLSSSNNSIYDNRVYNTDGAGFWIESASNNNTITSNTVDTNSGNGILITDSQNSLITNNTVNNNDGDGISIQSSDQTLISNNTVNDNVGALQLSSANNNTVTNNSFFQQHCWTNSVQFF